MDNSKITRPKSGSTVIGICGPSGSGKTTLVQKVVDLLDDATMLSIDAYHKIAQRYPTYRKEGTPAQACYGRWLKEGADPNLFISIPKQVEDLQTLKAGQEVHIPESMKDFFPEEWHVARPARFIVMEDMWGRERQEIASLLDLVVFLNTPLDIALCRKILRDAEQGWNPTSVVKWYLHVEDLHAGYADGTQETGGIGAHYIYERMLQVAQTADLVLDGMKDPDQLASEVVRFAHDMNSGVSA